MLPVTSKYYLNSNFILIVVNFPNKLTSRKEVGKCHMKRGHGRAQIFNKQDWHMKHARHQAEGHMKYDSM